MICIDIEGGLDAIAQHRDLHTGGVVILRVSRVGEKAFGCRRGSRLAGQGRWKELHAHEARHKRKTKKMKTIQLRKKITGSGWYFEL